MNIAPFKLERYFARYEFDVDHLLCSSDCESLAIANLPALEPGTMYDVPNNHFRIGFGRKNMPEAVARLAEFLQTHSV